MDLTETRKVLDELASRAILVDVEWDGKTTYTLPPPMAGFFEFSMMRLRGDVDQKVLGELFYQYLNVEEEFIRALFVAARPSLGGSSCMNRFSQRKTPCMCWITNAPARSSTPPVTGGWASATAATRCSTWDATAMRPWTSA